jgi:hypothetical protein
MTGVKTKKLKTYRVLYAVTRGEWYEIEAPDADTACDIAFSEGEQVEGGDTTDVVDCDVEEVPPTRKKRGGQ